MSKSGAKLYCRLLDYIEDKYPKLFDVVKVLCLEYLFTVRGKAGVTFLCPTDTDELVKLANSGVAENMIKASDMLTSLVLPLALRNVDEFRSMGAKGLPNKLGLKVPIDAAKSNSGKAVMTNGAEIELDKEFHTFKKDQLMFIYTLKGAIPPIDPNARADMSIVQQRKDEIKTVKQTLKKEGKGMDYLGSFELSQEDNQNSRIMIITTLENKYRADKKNGVYGGWGALDDMNTEMSNCLIEAGIELACFVLRNDRPLFEDTIYPLVSFGPADIYILLQPFAKFSDSSRYYIPSDHVKKWCEWRKDNKCSIEMRDEVLDAVRKRVPGRDIVKNISQARSHVLGAQKKAEEIKNFYKILANGNRIGNFEKVFPSGLISKYASGDCQKMHEDELRFVLTLQYESLDIDFDDATFEDTIEFASEFQRACSQGHADKLSFIRDEIGDEILSRKVGIFAASSLFLYMPLFREDFDPIQKDSTLFPKPGEYKLWNYHKMITTKTNRILTSQNAQSKRVLENMLKGNSDFCAALGDDIISKIKAALK